MGKKEFAAIILNIEHKTFIIHVVSLSITSLSSTLLNAIYSFSRPQIACLIAKEAPIKVFDKYVNFADVFFLDLASKLFEYIKINDYAIKMVDSQQSLYKPIYSLRMVELETLKAYIKTNLANKFIRPSKSHAGAPILFNRKSDNSLWLCINYQGLNNLMIKNRYPLLLIEKLLDRLGRVK